MGERWYCLTQMVTWEGDVIRNMRLWSKQKSSVLDRWNFFTLKSGLGQRATWTVPANSKIQALAYTWWRWLTRLNGLALWSGEWKERGTTNLVSGVPVVKRPKRCNQDLNYISAFNNNGFQSTFLTVISLKSPYTLDDETFKNSQHSLSL